MPRTAFDRLGSSIDWTDLPGRLPARVFVHGLGANGQANFGRVVGRPELGDHRSIVVDLPGMGRSDRPADFSYSLEAHAAAVAGVIRAAGLANVDLVGHSLGGDTSIVVAYRNPGLVGRLIISEANLDPLPASSSGRASQGIRLETEDEFVATGFEALMDREPGWATTLRLCDARAIHRSAVGLTSGTTPTTREMLTAMTLPRSFLHGDHGEPLLGAAGLRAAGIGVVTIANAGHMVMHDNLEAYVRALGELLST